MNRKVLTLCAGFLLAGSLTAVAQTPQWVEVTGSQLVNNGEYKILLGDSILQKGTEAFSGSNYAAPCFQERSKVTQGTDTIFVLKKVENGFTLSHKESNTVVYTFSDGTLLSNGGATDDRATVFTLNADSTLSIGEQFADWYGTVLRVADKENASKFAFYMQKAEVPTGADEATTEELGVASTIYVINADGEYVGISTKTTKASDAYDLSEVSTLPEEDAEAYVWINQGGVLKNYTANVYLTVAEDGSLDLSDEAVAVTTTPNILTAEGNSASVVLANASNPLPANFGSAWGDKQLEIKTDNKGNVTPEETSVVVYANAMQAIRYQDANGDGEYEYSIGQYAPNLGTNYVLSISKVQEGQGNYKVYLMNGGAHVEINGQWVELDVNATKDSWGLPTNGQVLLKAGNQYIALQNGNLVVVPANQATYFGLGQLQNAYMSANSLIYRYGDYFTLKITYKDNQNNDVDLTGEFKGQLRPVRSVTYNNGQTDYVDAQAETEFMLVNEDGNILAVNIDKPLHDNNVQDYGYAITTITPHEYQLAVALDNDSKADTYNPYITTFSLAYTPGTAQNDVRTITGIEVDGVVDGSPVHLNIGRQSDNQKVVLSAAAPAYLVANGISIALNAGSLVDGSEWLTKPAYYTIEVINKSKVNAVHFEKVLGLSEYGKSVAWVDKENIDLTKPEGQFAITYENGVYSVQNRESEASTSFFNNGDLYQIDATTFAFVTSAGTDTLAIKPITDYAPEDGFKRYTAAELNANTYEIAMNLLDDSYLNVVENHNDKHRIGLDREEVTEWRIEMPTVMLKDAANDDIRLVPDTVTVNVPIKYWVTINGTPTLVSTDDKDSYYGRYYDADATLKIPTYILKNTDTNEYLLGKDGSESVGNAYYVCEESEEDATRVAFKIVGDSTLNIVPVYAYSTGNWTTDMAMKEASYEDYAENLSLSNYKIIGGTTSKTGVLKDAELYEAIANDLFVINEAAAPTYKKVDQGSNIILSRVKNNDEVIYEAGEFAGISNRVAYKDINPTLYVDSAYVDRTGNYAYQYLLMVQPSLSNSWYCPYNNEHNSEAWKEENGVDHCADAVRTDRIDGRFLVNMVDSAEANKDVHNNKFAYNGETKLAFVDGFHQNDTLFFTNEAGDITSKVAVGNADFNFAKFAFKMIDETDNEFVIETGLGYNKKWNYAEDNNGNWHWTEASKEVTPGYLRWVNGNLVVTQNLDEAERFTMEDSELQATANESITAEGAVSVVATDGAVIIRGAEGKNVVIATILGKVVANETVTSDNETIAVPAGIAVVSVDGESFKVVVK